MTSQAKLPGGQVVKWQDKEFPNAYVNIMGFTMTAFDISLILGQIGDATPSEVTGIPQVKVTLSPEQALNMMKLLSLAVETYTNCELQEKSIWNSFDGRWKTPKDC
jgi:hypothetical protein